MILSHQKNALFIIIGLVILFLTTYSLAGSSMSLFSKSEEEVILCSPIEGIITFKGKPVANIKIDRWLKWKDETGEIDSTYTDDKGQFSLPVKKEIVKGNALSQFVVAQEIRASHNEVEYPIWAKAKRAKEMFGELDGKPVNFRCELTDELVRVDAGRGTLMTSCKWDSIKTKE